ncbi:Zinc knuckle [Trypanosoma brucei equiperdum]|uniref:Zinc knuckle n=1 Tax=Trypanosoma brucei equiperdum TaxID=630700 RepID=A0A3L6L9M9_9TRYP|nr:Zinc knuckle [Trypanosoma brucei equiperdum]
MYGNKGPPRKYSTPRGVDETSNAKKTCQKCGSKVHWTFECKGVTLSRGAATTRLSRTQQLRWGIKQQRQEFVPEPTEWEAYKERVKGVERQLVAEARAEVNQKKQRLEDRTGVKRESEEQSDMKVIIKEEDNTHNAKKTFKTEE